MGFGASAVEQSTVVPTLRTNQTTFDGAKKSVLLFGNTVVNRKNSAYRCGARTGKEELHSTGTDRSRSGPRTTGIGRRKAMGEGKGRQQTDLLR
jgi:hypothetical protein